MIATRLPAYLAIGALLSISLWILLLLPNFLDVQGWSSQRIGWAIGCFFLCNLVVQLQAGPLADRIGNVPVALWGSVIGVAGGLCYIAALHRPLVIFPARLLHAAAAAMIFSGALLQLLKSVPAPVRGRMIGYFGLPGFVTMGAGPFLSEWVIYHWGFQGVFWLIPGLFVAIALILANLKRPLVSKKVQRQPFLPALKTSFIALRGILAFSASFGLGFSAWNGFLAPAVTSLGMGAVSGFGFGYGLGALITRLGVSRKLDSGPQRLVAISTLLAYSVGLACIPLVQYKWQLTFLGFVCGTAHGTFFPSLSSMATERFPPLHEGQALSLYISAAATGMFLGPPLWGLVADWAGYPIMFAGAALILGTSTILFVVFHRSRA